MKIAKSRFIARGIMVLLAFFVASAAPLSAAEDPYPVADPVYEGGAIIFQPKIEYDLLVLRVTGPDGSVFYKEFDSGSSPVYEVGHDANGRYTYELFVIPKGDIPGRKLPDDGVKMGREPDLFGKAMQQSYSFSAVDGQIIFPTGPGEGDKDPDRVKDVLHYDDVIITGSLCVGFDCADGESFGFDTIILKEHNLRIYFNDTSYAASYPTNNWRIVINDSTNGGGSFFAIDDVDEGTRPFVVEAGSPSNSLYVEDYGRVGLGTSTPVVELHIKDSDTPTTRLEQDSSGGWTAQTWDVAGNESNFFIRDATNGSKLPFRIQPSTPSSTLSLKSDGKVGIGTWSPAYGLEVENSETGGKAEVATDRVGGATTIMRGTDTQGTFGTVTNHRLRLLTDDTWRLELETDDSLTMASGAECTAAGVWTDASSRELKENINELSVEDALEAFTGLKPVTYNYKKVKNDQVVGFIAEDVPELVAQKDRKTLSSMDITAVLTKVVQEQQKLLEKQDKTIREQAIMMEKLSRRIEQLEKNK